MLTTFLYPFRSSSLPILGMKFIEKSVLSPVLSFESLFSVNNLIYSFVPLGALSRPTMAVTTPLF